MFLVANGFAIQMFSTLRPIFESLNLVKLFACEPLLADGWAAGDHAAFTAAKVRKRLGLDDDPEYSFMCARSHPRFAGAQLSAFLRLEGDQKSAIFLTGGLSLGMRAILLAAPWPSRMLANIALAAELWPFNDPADEAFLGLVTTIVRRSLPGTRQSLELLHPHGIPDGSDSAALLETLARFCATDDSVNGEAIL